MKKRLLSFLLALVMVLSVFPMTVFADGDETGPVEEIEETATMEEETEPVEELPAEETELVEKTELVEEIEPEELPVSESSPKRAATLPTEGDVCQIGEGETATSYTSLDEAIAANKNTENVITITSETPLAFTAASTLAVGENFRVNNYQLVDFAKSTFPEGAKSFDIKVSQEPDFYQINIYSYIAKTSQNTYATLDEAIKANKNTSYAISIPNLVPGNTPTVTAAAELQAGDYFYITRTGYSLITFSDNAFPAGYGKKVYSIKDNTTHYEIDVEEFVAQNVTTGVGYTSLSSAISGAKNGETVKLLKNQSTSNIPISNKNQITLDLNKKTVNFTNVGFYLSDNVNLTIKNGTVKTSYVGVYSNATPNLTLENIDMTLTAGDYYAIWLQNGGTLNLVNTHIKVMCGEENEPYAIQVEEKSPYNITFDKDSTIDSSYLGICLYGSGKVGTSGGTLNVYGKINALGHAISTSGNQQVGDDVINIFPGAELKSQYAHGIYAPAKGVINMTGGKVSGDGSGIAIKSGKLNVSGGEIICTGDDLAPTEGWSNGAHPSGAAIQIESNKSYGDIEVNISGNAKITSSDGYSVYEYKNETNPMRVKSLSITGGQFTGLICLSEELAGSATGKGFISAGLYDKEIKGNKVNFIAPGYACLPNTDPATRGDYPWIVTRLEVNVEPATVSESGDIVSGKTETGTDKVIDVKTVENGEVAQEDKDAAAASITGMVTNPAVATFVETNIESATSSKTTTVGSYDISMVLNALKEEANKGTEAGSENASVTGDGQITVSEQPFTDQDVDKRINVELEAAKVETKTEAGGSSVKTTTVNSATYDVTPTAKITVTTTDESGETTTVTYTAKIPNEAITAPITFRLPIDKKIKAATTAVWHSDSLNNPKAEYLGVYPIQEENGNKFVELSASKFSYYTYENMTGIEENDAAVIRNSTNEFFGFGTLEDALAAFNGSGDGAIENAVEIILLKDVEGNTAFDFGGKTMALDLNGHKLIGSAANAASVTVSNGNPDSQTTLAATGIYANDVSAFVADGYDTRKTTVDNDTVFNSTAADVFTVKVVPVKDSYTDRDSVTDGIDLYAGDTIEMEVRVYGAKFVGADVTLYYDKTNFKMTDAPTSGWDGDVKWYDDEDSQNKLAGKTRFYAAKSTQGGASSYYELNETDGDVKYYSLGTFEFEALPGANEALKVAFQVEPIATGEIGRDGTTSGQDVAPVYVAGAWSQGWNSSPANKLTQGADDTHLVNALVNVRLKSMSAVVNGVTGLVYNASERNLVQPGAGAKDSITQQAISSPTITYAVVTKAEADADTFDASTLTYTNTIPQKTDAGDYVVFYRVSKDGYITVADKLNVSIAKKDVNLSWTFGSGDAYKTGDDTTTEIVSDFYIAYTEGNTTGYTAPTATYTNAGDGDPLTATVTLTSFNDADPAEDTKLIKVGKYVYTATVDPNYNIKSKETAVVEVTGAHITGYTLTAKNNTEAEPTIGNIWYDGAAHTPAQLNKASGATADVTIKYHTLAPGATQWTVSDTIPAFTAAGTYQVKAVLTKDSYYDLTLDTVTFTIKSATYVTEKFDWVTGWDVVLVYTNDIVPGFTYDGAKMYDVSELGYKYGTTKNADGTVGTQAYTHVFGLVIAGDADITKVTSSNVAAEDINYSTKTGNTTSGVAWARLDVNSSSSVELLDLVFVQGVYNVNETYMAQQMANVLKSDVNGDKMVDTRDCALIKANS